MFPIVGHRWKLAPACNGMTLQKCPETFRLIRNALNLAKRPAGESLNFAVTGKIINALVLFPDKETLILAQDVYSMTEKFQVQFLEEATGFLDRLDEKARDKVVYNIQKARLSNDKELFKKLNGEIWEFRTLFNRTHYRLFAFWDFTRERSKLLDVQLSRIVWMMPRITKIVKPFRHMSNHLGFSAHKEVGSFRIWCYVKLILQHLIAQEILNT
jgi:hypothetical protein